MTSFAGRVARMQEAVFRALGEDATWSGVDGTVRVRFRERDEVEGFGSSQVLVTDRIIQVRRAVIAKPAKDDIVTLQESGLTYRVMSEPRLDRKGRWTCVAAPA